MTYELRKISWSEPLSGTWRRVWLEKKTLRYLPLKYPQILHDVPVYFQNHPKTKANPLETSKGWWLLHSCTKMPQNDVDVDEWRICFCLFNLSYHLMMPVFPQKVEVRWEETQTSFSHFSSSILLNFFLVSKNMIKLAPTDHQVLVQEAFLELVIAGNPTEIENK